MSVSNWFTALPSAIRLLALYIFSLDSLKQVETPLIEIFIGLVLRIAL